MEKTYIRERFLIREFGTNIFHLVQVYKSREISLKSKFELSKLYLINVPEFNFVFYKKLTMLEQMKNIYYYIFSNIPFFLKIFLILTLNLPWYFVINSLKKHQ